VDERGVLHHEVVHALAKLFFTDEVEVPHGVIEDDQHIRKGVQGGEDLGELFLVGRGGVLLEGLHPRHTALAGQVMDAEVEGLVAAEGGAPLDRYGDVAGGGDGAQQHGRVDGVVIGD
jgi:hypothetical protein